MKLLDWIIVAAYLTYVIWDGIRMTKHSKNVEGYFLANRSLPWWAVGLSVMATQLSAITLVGTTGQAYSDGMRFIQFYYGLPLAMIILCLTVVPFFHRAKVYTAYEYLEKRFDVRVRTLTSFFFLISRGLGVGVIISAPSIVLSIVFWLEFDFHDFRHRTFDHRLYDVRRCASRNLDGRKADVRDFFRSGGLSDCDFVEFSRRRFSFGRTAFGGFARKIEHG
jgi:uncharacterized sodium:solute symporter family permease YidK